MKELPEINQRIKEAINILADGKVSVFVKMAGIKSHQNLNRIFNIDKRSNKYPEPSAEILKCIKLNVPRINYDWLLTGIPPMLNEDNPTSTAYVNGMSANYQGNFTQPIHTEIGHRNEIGKITKNNIEDILKKENEKLKQQVSFLEAQIIIKDEIIEAKNKAIEEKERLIEEKDKRIEEKERLINILLDKK